MPSSLPGQREIMNVAATLAIALAMSTDAFAVAIGKGAALHRPHIKEALRTGLIFGVIEGLTPLVGWALGKVAAPYVEAWDHWIAFTLLGVLGLRMIHASLTADEEEEEKSRAAIRSGCWRSPASPPASTPWWSAPAWPSSTPTSYHGRRHRPATFTMVTLGVMLGRGLGQLVGKRAELIGGLVLIAIGGLILYEHLSAG
jgi:putative Mn2+ efflux pump MntP